MKTIADDTGQNKTFIERHLATCRRELASSSPGIPFRRRVRGLRWPKVGRQKQGKLIRGWMQMLDYTGTLISKGEVDAADALLTDLQDQLHEQRLIPIFLERICAAMVRNDWGLAEKHCFHIVEMFAYSHHLGRAYEFWVRSLEKQGRQDDAALLLKIAGERVFRASLRLKSEGFIGRGRELERIARQMKPLLEHECIRISDCDIQLLRDTGKIADEMEAAMKAKP